MSGRAGALAAAALVVLGTPPARAAAVSPPGSQPRAEARGGFLASGELARLIAEAQALARANPGKSVVTPLLVSPPYEAALEYHASPSSDIHSHDHDDELIVVLRGAGTMTLGGTLVNPAHHPGVMVAATSAGGRLCPLTPGAMLLIPAGTPHGVVSVKRRVVMLSLHLPQGAGPPSP